MAKYLYFNGTIRFYMEVFFEFCLLSSINLHAVDWETPFASVESSNLLSIVLLTLIFVMPLFYITVSCLRPEQWLEDKF